MSLNTNKIVTYSLLAYINSEHGNIQDLLDIFVPLLKRGIAQLCTEGVTRGKYEDIRDKICDIYSLEVPYPTIKIILERFKSQLSASEQRKVMFFEDDGFIIDKYFFGEYEEVIEQQTSQINAVQLLYEQHLQKHGIHNTDEHSLFEFLDKNRIILSQYFASKTTTELDKDYFVQAEFINSLKNQPEIFDILRKIYLGSIIASYLQIEVKPSSINNIEFLLDTSFIISLLGLHSEESRDTCKKIWEVCKHLNYRTTVLDFTIEETTVLLRRVADEYDSHQILPALIDKENILANCHRKGLNKTDVMMLAEKLSDKLREEFRIQIIQRTEQFREQAKNSSEFQAMKARRKYNPEGAWHDLTAVKYVQHKRGKKVKIFHEANCWFVTDAKGDYKSYIDKLNRGMSPETIRAEELANILWLTYPRLVGDDLMNLGLTRLISTALDSDMPKPRVLKEFDANIQKYVAEDIQDQDYLTVASIVANRTINNAQIEELNRVAKNDQYEFTKRVKKVIEAQKQADAEKEKRSREYTLKLQKAFEQKLKQQNETIEFQNKNIQEVLRQHEEQFVENQKYQTQESLRKNKQLQLVNIEDRLLSQKRHFNTLNNTKIALEKEATRFASNSLYGILIALLLVYSVGGYFWNTIDWNKVEKWTWFLQGAPFIPPVIALLIYYKLTGKDLRFDWKPSRWEEAITKQRLKKLFSKYSFNHEGFDLLQQEIVQTENDLRLQFEELSEITDSPSTTADSPN